MPLRVVTAFFNTGRQTMRKARWVGSVFVLALLAFGMIANGAEREDKEGEHTKLPKAITKSLKAKFPHAEIRGVSKEKNSKDKTIYEVELTVLTKVDVEFHEDGELEVIERQIGAFELPDAVRKSAAKIFPAGRIHKAESVVEDEGELKYELVIELSGNHALEVLMAANGQILKIGSKSSDEDEKPAVKKHEKGEKAGKHEEEEKDEKPKVKKHEGDGKAKKHKEKEEHEKSRVKKHEGSDRGKTKNREEEDDDRPAAKKHDRGGKAEDDDES